MKNPQHEARRAGGSSTSERLLPNADDASPAGRAAINLDPVLLDVLWHADNISRSAAPLVAHTDNPAQVEIIVRAIMRGGDYPKPRAVRAWAVLALCGRLK